jgi:hypothetical protein
VGRLSASLRNGHWADAQCKAEKFELTELLKTVQSFGGLPIYGWEYFDLDDQKFKEWSGRLSLDWHGSPSAMTHSLTLFQVGYAPERTLDLKIWFNEITFRQPTGELIPTEEVIAGGKRWWDGLRSGDKRTQGHGIVSGNF